MRLAYSGFFFDSSGYGEMTRRYLFALLQTDGLDVTPGAILADGGWQIPPTADLQIFGGLRRVGPPDVHALCVTGADLAGIQIQEIPPWIPRVGLMCWETDRLHPTTLAGCQSVKRVIVPSQHNAAVFERAGLKAEVVPIPVEVPRFIDELPLQGIDDVGEETYIFYSLLTWQDRKNPFGLIAAFCQAFTDRDDVMLVLKVSGPDADKAVAQAAGSANAVVQAMGLSDAPTIRVIGGRMSPAHLWALHQRGQCYVSLAKGEAYGIPMLDAAAVGNHVISTGYGGQLDFLPPANSSFVRYRMTPVMQRYSHFNGRMLWAEPDVLHAAELMHAAFMRGRQPKIIPDLTHLLPYNIGTKLAEALAV